MSCAGGDVLFSLTECLWESVVVSPNFLVREISRANGKFQGVSVEGHWLKELYLNQGLSTGRIRDENGTRPSFRTNRRHNF